ncbi:MAG: toxin [Candidatus Anammoxibacter sp.]
MFKWNSEKNKILYEIRGVTFDEVVQAISDGYGVSDVPHWNKEKYPKQRIITVMINNYTYLVPYVRDGEDYFLKTIIPSRKEKEKVQGENNV